jgi:hypothetical protein
MYLEQREREKEEEEEGGEIESKMRRKDSPGEIL